MNPPNQEATGSQLPISAPEQALPSTGDDMNEGLREGSERPAGAERTSGPSSGAAISTIPLPEPPQLTQSASTAIPPADTGSTPAQDSALPADDNDLIEKEWVNKAKQIVERTRDDPYKQSEDLTIFKADYIKKRYGKTIKVSQ